MPTNEELQRELVELREEMRQMRAALAASQAPTASEPRLLSRRNLLRAAPVAAVGGAIAAMSATPAAAATGDPVLLGQVNDAGSGKMTQLSGGTYVANPTGPPSPVTTDDSPALSVHGGLSTDWLAASGLSVGVQSGRGAYLYVAPENNSPGQDVGIVASFNPPFGNYPHYQGTADAVEATVTGAIAYSAWVSPGTHESGYLGGTGFEARVFGGGIGVDAYVADGTDPAGNPVSGVALSGTATTGDALRATATAGHAINASTTSTTTTEDAVTIEYAGKSRALWAESTSPTNINGTITGVNAGNGIGVWGEQRGTGAGFGLVGVGGKAGRGAQLTGGAAQLRMVPGSAATHPTTGKAGDFFVDSANRLWFCQKPSSGSTAATWKQLA